MRGSWRGACSSVVILVLAGCGGSSHSSPTRTKTTSTPTSTSRLTEVLAVPAVGRFYGRCAITDHEWTLQFVADPTADDQVTYRIGNGPPQRSSVRPGGGLTWHLRPAAFRSRQPPDPLTHNPAATVRTTLPLKLEISQGTEPHTFRVDAQLALAAAIGGTANCALVSSRISALTYFHGG